MVSCVILWDLRPFGGDTYYIFTMLGRRSKNPGVPVQSNLAIRNFLVTLKFFLNAKCSLSCWVRVHQRRIGGVKMKKEIRKHSHAGQKKEKRLCGNSMTGVSSLCHNVLKQGCKS